MPRPSARSIAVATIIASASLAAACDVIGPRRSPEEKLYRKHCASCHGVDASGNTPRYMGNAAADLRDPNWRNIAGDPSSIEEVIRDGVFGKMPPNPDLTYEEVQLITDWVLLLRGEGR